jgi:hypothetical protein
MSESESESSFMALVSREHWQRPQEKLENFSTEFNNFNPKHMIGRHSESERSAELRVRVTRAPLTHNGARHCWTEAVLVGIRAREA